MENNTESQIRQTTDDAVEIDLAEIFYLLWGHIVQIVICLMIGASAAFAYTYFLVTPMYSATAKMYILTNNGSSVVDLSALQISNNLRQDYQELITSRLLLEDVIKKLDLDMTYKQLGGCLSVVNPTDTRIITVTATVADPKQAANIANEVVNQAKENLPEIMKTDEPSVYEPAIVPTAKTSPSYSKNTLIGGFLVAFVYMAIIVVKYLMNDTLVTPDDVTRYLGIEPLAAIPEGDLGAFNKKKKRSKGGKKE